MTTMDLSPKSANKKIFEGDGGSYYSWSYPMLGESNVCAGILQLRPGGFALPHYADCSKVGYVLQGEHGVAGAVLLNGEKHSKQEIVLGLRKGDVIPLPLGSASWWYNNGDSDLVIVFLGETSAAYVPGEITYFVLTGAQGIMGGFSSEFTSRAYDMTENEAKIITESQNGVLIIKLSEDERERIPKPLPQQDNVNLWVTNVANFPADLYVEKAGTVTKFTGSNFPFLEQVGLSCSILKLDANAMLSPIYNSKTSVFYVVKGSGTLQIVGLNAKLALDTNVKEGQLVIVPRCFALAVIAGAQGIETYSITTSTRPAAGELGGKESVMNVFSSSVVQLALHVDDAFLQYFKEKLIASEILVPPKN